MFLRSCSKLTFLDSTLDEWMVVHAESGPVDRSGHTFTVYGDQVFLFGGKTADGKYLDDLRFFWTGTMGTIRPTCWYDRQPAARFKGPSARANHTVTSCGGRLYLFVVPVVRKYLWLTGLQIRRQISK